MSRPDRKRAFTVRPVWDDEAGVWITDSDVRGLHIEADTIEELERLVLEFAPGLIAANHLSAEDLAGTPMRDLVPVIRITTPKKAA